LSLYVYRVTNMYETVYILILAMFLVIMTTVNSTIDEPFDCQNKPYTNGCYGDSCKQRQAVFDKFLTTSADFESYQWLNQFNRQHNPCKF
jgi:hypothetical protein